MVEGSPADSRKATRKRNRPHRRPGKGSRDRQQLRRSIARLKRLQAQRGRLDGTAREVPGVAAGSRASSTQLQRPQNAAPHRDDATGQPERLSPPGPEPQFGRSGLRAQAAPFFPRGSGTVTPPRERRELPTPPMRGLRWEGPGPAEQSVAQRCRAIRCEAPGPAERSAAPRRRVKGRRPSDQARSGYDGRRPPLGTLDEREEYEYAQPVRDNFLRRCLWKLRRARELRRRAKVAAVARATHPRPDWNMVRVLAEDTARRKGCVLRPGGNATGDCFHDACSRAAFGRFGRQNEVRERVWRERHDNPHRYAEFIEYDADGRALWEYNGDGDYRSFHAFNDRQRRPGEWAGPGAVAAAAQVFRRRIVVHVVGPDNTVIVEPEECRGEDMVFLNVPNFHFYSAEAAQSRCVSRRISNAAEGYSRGRSDPEWPREASGRRQTTTREHEGVLIAAGGDSRGRLPGGEGQIVAEGHSDDRPRQRRTRRVPAATPEWQRVPAGAGAKPRGSPTAHSVQSEVAETVALAGEQGVDCADDSRSVCVDSATPPIAVVEDEPRSSSWARKRERRRARAVAARASYLEDMTCIQEEIERNQADPGTEAPETSEQGQSSGGRRVTGRGVPIARRAQTDARALLAAAEAVAGRAVGTPDESIETESPLHGMLPQPVRDVPTSPEAREVEAAIRESTSDEENGEAEQRWQCQSCGECFPASGYSNRQRRLIERGVAPHCYACVEAATEAGKAKAARAAASAAQAAAEAAAPAVTRGQRDAAFARWRQRQAARAAGRAAARSIAAAEYGGEEESPIFFRSHRPGDPSGGRYACFSNWYPSPFADDLGLQFANAEQFLMHRKARTFGDLARAAEILRSPDPAASKALGRQVEPFDQERWRQYRECWCEDGLWRKFRTHEDLAEVLLSTGQRQLVECSADDAVWGVGAGLEQCRAMAAPELQRRCADGNLLGKVLMRVRSRLRRARAIAEHTANLPWQCDPVNGGVDWELFADTLECFRDATCIREREQVCSQTGHRWQDYELIDILRRVPLEGGVSASEAAVAELDSGGVDRVAGANGRLTSKEDVIASVRILQAELEGGLTEGPFENRRDLGSKPIWTHPASLVDKSKDGKPKMKATIDYVLGIVRDGEYGADLQLAKRWVDNMSAGKIAARTPDGRRSKTKPALDSLNAFSPLSTPCTLDDVRYMAELVMRLRSDGGRLSGGDKRKIEGSATDIAQAYRNVPIRKDHRRLFTFRFLDVRRPIPQYVLDGEQPRDSDLVWYRKCTLPFGWTSSVDYWVRISKAIKALHMWDDCPGVATSIPRVRRPDGSWSKQHGIGTYIDDSGIFAVQGWGQVAQDRYIELCDLIGVPISREKLEAEGDVSPVVALLGVLLDCDAEELRLSTERLKMLASRCREAQGKDYVSRKELQNLVGILSFATSCAPAGRTFMRRLYQAVERKGTLCRLNRGLKCDLAWWLKFVLEDGGWHGKSMIVEDFATLAEELGLFTDASLEGFGATFVLPDGTCEVFSGRWDEVLPGIDTSQAAKEWSISELELLVVVMAMTQWAEHFTQRRIVMRCDNEAAVIATNSGRARAGAMSALLRELWFVKMRGSFDVRAKHVKTHDNQLGDIPSRWTLADGSRDRDAETELYAHLWRHYGVAADNVREVPVVADTTGLLRRMSKAHRAKA